MAGAQPDWVEDMEEEDVDSIFFNSPPAVGTEAVGVVSVDAAPDHPPQLTVFAAPPAPPHYPWPLPAECAAWSTATLTPRYQLLSALGKGGYGEVWLALDHSAAPPLRVAIKRERVVGGGLPAAHGVRIIREIGLLRKLQGMSNLLQLVRVLPPLTPAGLPDAYFSEV